MRSGIYIGNILNEMRRENVWINLYKAQLKALNAFEGTYRGIEKEPKNEVGLSG